MGIPVSRTPGHVWRPIRAGIKRLVRVADCVTVAEVHSTASGFLVRVPGLPDRACKGAQESVRLAEQRAMEK